MQDGNLDTHTALIYDAVLLFAQALDRYSRIQVRLQKKKKKKKTN